MDETVERVGLEIIRGSATLEELAAVVGVLATRAEPAGEARTATGYAAWRRTRLATLRGRATREVPAGPAGDRSAATPPGR
jgi:hypothetical protein